ncbi:DNA topoisomerase 2-like [Athalia rosae]|uniref:DNA topoisomerase 2-like n=1 Tax=Athalia rosae TaxID=37344 RepID=UPI002034A4E2|nr:DNA topoisomerase 2-like [Athalia rosae]
MHAAWAFLETLLRDEVPFAKLLYTREETACLNHNPSANSVASMVTRYLTKRQALALIAMGDADESHMSERVTAKFSALIEETWINNMTKESEPRIKDLADGKDFTKVTFSPDSSKFKIQALDNDMVSLMTRRAYEVAASTKGVEVFLNNTIVPVRSFKDYVDLYVKGKKDDIGKPLQVSHTNCGTRWQVALTSSDRGFQHPSFVNGIATQR